MTKTATVNYHVHKPERQAFHLDAGGVAGHLISPELAPTEITVSDVRTNPVGPYAAMSVGFDRFVSAVDEFENGSDWHGLYDGELTLFLKERLGAKDVVVFDHTVRVDDPKAKRPPARNVHSDYSEQGAQQRLIDILGPAVASEWAKGHYAFVNVWRPVEFPINSAPLGFVLPHSVAASDWITLDLIYPDRKGQILGLAANADHHWIYMSKMTPNDVAYFNIYDNQGQPSIAHSALDLVEDASVQTVRKSIESRTLVQY